MGVGLWTSAVMEFKRGTMPSSVAAIEQRTVVSHGACG